MGSDFFFLPELKTLIMTRTHSFIGFFTASYYPTPTIPLTFFWGLILLKGGVYNVVLEDQEDIRNKEKSSSSCSLSRKALFLRGHAVSELRKKSAALTRWPPLICMMV